MKKKPEIKPEGFGLSNKGEGRAPQIRHNRPEVAKHCARMIIAHNMDAEAAVAKMLAADYPDATDAQIVSLARTVQASPHVQREIAGLLEEIGCGDAALKKLIGGLWGEFLGQNDKRWAAAARLLAEITGAAKASMKNDKIPVLKLAGMEAGLQQMLGDAAPTNEDTIDVEDTDVDASDSTTEHFGSDQADGQFTS
jgi:hypothetical protein